MVNSGKTEFVSNYCNCLFVLVDLPSSYKIDYPFEKAVQIGIKKN